MVRSIYNLRLFLFYIIFFLLIYLYKYLGEFAFMILYILYLCSASGRSGIPIRKLDARKAVALERYFSWDNRSGGVFSYTDMRASLPSDVEEAFSVHVPEQFFNGWAEISSDETWYKWEDFRQGLKKFYMEPVTQKYLKRPKKRS